MSKRQTKQYSAKLKAKIVMEVLKNERTIAEIASEYKTHPKNIQNWRKQFLENVECVFDKEQLLREYKSELRSKNEQADELYRQIGKLTAQVDWAKKKVGELRLEY